MERKRYVGGGAYICVYIWSTQRFIYRYIEEFLGMYRSLQGILRKIQRRRGRDREYRGNI